MFRWLSRHGPVNVSGKGGCFGRCCFQQLRGRRHHRSGCGAELRPDGSDGGGSAAFGDVLGNVQVAVPVTVPVNVSGNAVGVLGDAASNGSEATEHHHCSGCGAGTPARTDQINGGGLLGGVVGDVLGNGQVAVPVTVPVNVSGNAVGVLGDGASNDSEAADTTTVPAVEQELRPGFFAGQRIKQRRRLLGGVVGDVLGNVQVAVPVTVPVNVSGNAVGVLGDGASSNSEAADATTVPAVEHELQARTDQTTAAGCSAALLVTSWAMFR